LDLNVLHWDITSIYFEGAYTDSELAAYGYSRDHRPDTKQVNLEVDVSHDGYVSCPGRLECRQTAAG
jgi:transposase